MELDMKYFEEMEAKIPHGKVRTRFAPSPTGYMHVGNLRTALYTWLIARHAGGTFILRIEDTDQGRLVEGATDVIYRTLAECKLDHDEGPDVGGPVAPYIQSQRRDTYGKYARLLVEKGGAYYCFCEKCASEEDSGEFDRAADPCRELPLEDDEQHEQRHDACNAGRLLHRDDFIRIPRLYRQHRFQRNAQTRQTHRQGAHVAQIGG